MSDLLLLRPAARRLTLSALLGVAAAVAGVALMATSAWLISRAAQQPPVLVLAVAVVGVRAFGLARPVLRYLERLVGHDAGLSLLVDLRARVFRTVAAEGPRGLTVRRRGDVLARLVGDVEAVPDLALRVLVPWVVSATVALLGVAVVGVILPSAVPLTVLGLLIAGVGAPVLTAATARRSEAFASAARADVWAATSELLGAAPDLVATGAVPARLAALDATEARLTRAERTSARWVGAGSALAVVGLGLPVVGALVMGIPAVRDGSLDRVLLAVVVLVPLAVGDVLSGLPAASLAWRRTRTRVARLTALTSTNPGPLATGPLATEPLATGPLATGPLATGLSPRLPAPRREGGAPPSLELDGVTLRWPDAAAPVLRNVRLHVPGGAHVAVVGPSGAGKSTLVAALLGLLTPETGRVLLGGVDVDTYGDGLPALVTWCGQDAHVFHTSVRENLRLARPDADDASLRDVLATVGLLVRVEAQPGGLDAVLGEEGATLSGGERQRLAVARALLVDAPVVVLDEPSAHLPEDTAADLMATLHAATAGRTLLVVTHRVAGLDRYDDVVRVGDGRAVSSGAPAHTGGA